MRLLVINPNTSADMTASIAEAIAGYLPKDYKIITETGCFGGRVIASRAAYAIAGHAALDAYARHHGQCDSVVLACFGDPGLEALREVADVPVTGLLEASVRQAGAAGRPFGIVTAGAAWGPMIAERIALMEEASLHVGTEILDGSGLDVRRDPDSALRAIAEASERLVRKGAAAVILGGAAMAGLVERLTLPIEAIDCLAAAAAVISTARGEAVHPMIATRPFESESLPPALADLLAGRR